jgi:hypothetical protein
MLVVAIVLAAKSTKSKNQVYKPWICAILIRMKANFWYFAGIAVGVGNMLAALLVPKTVARESLKHYILIGDIGDAHAHCLTEKDLNECELISGVTEIKKEFDAPNWEIARVVYEVYNGYIIDADQYVLALAQYYGYTIEKIP